MRKSAADVSVKLNARWVKGCCVGKIAETDTHVLLTEAGAVKGRAVNKFAGEASSHKEFLKKVKGSPWNPTGKADELVVSKEQL